MNITDLLVKLINVADYRWNDKEMVCVSLWGDDDRVESERSILQQNGLKLSEVSQLKTLGIMSHMVLDDGCVILNLHYDKVLSNTNYSEEFLLNLGWLYISFLIYSLRDWLNHITNKENIYGYKFIKK